MRWLDSFIEKITHRHMLEDRITQLREELSRANDRLGELQKAHDEHMEKALRADEALSGLNARVRQLQEDTERDERLEAAERDRTELCRRIEDLNTLVRSLAEKTERDERLTVVERDRTELFRRVDDLDALTQKLQRNAQQNGRLEVLEKDRTELFARVDALKENLRKCGILNLNARFDSRITRLEILNYYSDGQKTAALDSEQKRLLEELKSDYDYERNEGRTYPEDPYYEGKTDLPVPFPVREEDGLWYADVDGKKVFFGENKHDAEEYLKETVYWLEGDTPHRYLEPDKDGIDIPEGAVLLDIGAAEGYFGMRYLERCKKVYFFECDEKWLRYLRKTCAPYMDKVEIVQGYVGDREGDIRLDDFFETREKPNVIKMDIEGAEGAALRGMQKLLHDETIPLTLLICTYHRQEDWQRYEHMLGDQFELHSSNHYYWDIQDPYPPFFRRGIMRAVRKAQ